MLACECGAKTQVRIFLTITSWLTIAYYSVSINIFRTTSTYRDTFHRSLIGTTTYGMFLPILVLFCYPWFLLLNNNIYPYLQCVLAVLIIFSMKSLFLKIPHEILHLWRVSKIDFVSLQILNNLHGINEVRLLYFQMIWTVTFTATLSLNVMQGLAVSVSFALLTTVFRIQW